MTQLSFFDSPELAPGAQMVPQSPPMPNIIWPHQIRVPVDTEARPEVADQLHRIVRKIYERTGDLAAFHRCCRIWWTVLDRFYAGDGPYMEAIKGWDAGTLALVSQGFGILTEHFWCNGGFCDVLGDCYMRVRGDWAGKLMGQYFTPWALCVGMAQMQLQDIDRERLKEPLSVYDCACGSGAMLLAARAVVAHEHGREALRQLKVYGQDIDEVCWMMAKIQMRMSDAWWMTNFQLAFYGEIATSAGIDQGGLQ
jgi:hypothetical protein